MPDVDLRSKKTTSPHDDSWSLIDTRGAQALFPIKQPNARVTPRVTMLDPISLLGILQCI